MEIILIAAMARNRIIGRNNKLPWHIPEELRLFKATTMGYPMIMGRKTFNSFPAPLPGRRHIVLSRNRSFVPQGAECALSLEAALALCGQSEKVFIIGGRQVFATAMDIVTTIILTMIDMEIEGDVSFPEFSEKDFQETERVHYPKAATPFTVVTYHRLPRKG
jgi:dihydrofolate reductase